MGLKMMVAAIVLSGFGSTFANAATTTLVCPLEDQSEHVTIVLDLPAKRVISFVRSDGLQLIKTSEQFVETENTIFWPDDWTYTNTLNKTTLEFTRESGLFRINYNCRIARKQL